MSNHRLICGDVLDVLPTLGRFKCLIADPPDNIGLGYEGYEDKIPDGQYMSAFVQWLCMFTAHADIVWVSFNAKWLLQVGYKWGNLQPRLDWTRDYDARIFIQSFTFGQNNKHDCGNGYRPLLRLKHRDAKLYPEAIRVPSWRQLNGDKRAAMGGRVPLDHWSDFPRITGNCKERRAWHPTQLREGMIERIIKFSTLPGESICDAFSGTGTVLRAARNLGHLSEMLTYSGNIATRELIYRNPITSIELSPKYCLGIAAEHSLNVEMFEAKQSA